MINEVKHKILFATPVLEHPPKGGGELRIENSIKALAKISTVFLYCRQSRTNVGGDVAVSYLEHFVNRIYFAPFCHKRNNLSSVVLRGINLIARVLLGHDVFALSTEGVADYQDLLQTADAIGADVIWLGFGNVSYPLLKHIKENSDYPVVLDTDSVWSRFILRGIPYAMDDNERTQIEARGKAKEEEEKWGTEIADVTTAVSEVDAEYYRRLICNHDRVHLFSNVIDIDYYAPALPPAGFRMPSIYLAGTFWRGSPMEDAARWMLAYVLPLLKQEFPDIHFYIVGKDSDKFLADVHDDNVTITGELPTVLPYLTNASVAVVPLRFESGTRFKILEAGACGRPVVSTTLGAEGIPVVNGKDILIADTPDDFAHSVVKIIRDQELAISLGLNLKELVVRYFSIDTLSREGDEILKYVMSVGSRP